ncbi:MAG: IclR family transcriptional regulator [Candidatus Limnocylindrales bacterium]
MKTHTYPVNSDDAPATDGRGDAPLSPAVVRAAAILDLLASAALSNAPSPPTLSDVARRTGLPKSSVANICAALLQAGLIRRVGPGFGLGRRLAELGGAYLSTVDQVQVFHELTDQLGVLSAEIAHLAVLDGLDVTYIARHEGRQSLRIASEIGRRLPASCTALGKAALATLAGDVLDDRLKSVRTLPTLTPRSHRDVPSLLDDLDRVRQRGYAVDDEETSEGILCLGVAVPRGGPDDPQYAVSATLLKARADEALTSAIVADLHRLARLLANPMAREVSPADLPA